MILNGLGFTNRRLYLTHQFFKNKPVNTYQGSQFTSQKFTKVLEKHNIKISMNGKGRCLDNIFIERLWRSLKYECVYPRNFVSFKEAKNCLGEYFDYYNNELMHQFLGYKTPAMVYFAKDI